MEDGALVRNIERLTGIPAVLIQRRLDLSSPLDLPWMLAESWDSSELVVVDDAGHTGALRMIAATDRFADSRR
jgi:proline iminopeptidase